MIVIAITVVIWDRLWCILHRHIGLSSIHDKVLTSVALEHDPSMLVYTNTAMFAYDLSMTRSLFPSLWSTTRLCGCTLTPLCWLMIHPWLGHCFCHVVPWPTCVEDIITAALMYYLSVWIALPPLPCSMIWPWWGCTRCRFTNQDDGDDFMIPPHHRLDQRCCWWLPPLGNGIVRWWRGFPHSRIVVWCSGVDNTRTAVQYKTETVTEWYYIQYWQ